MSFGATSHKPWTLPSDDQLSWFLATHKCFAEPRPLQYTLEIDALVFGLTYALESLEFPLYALRSRLVNGHVYLAAVPSAMAESNLQQRLKNIHAQSVRFTRNIGSAWERQLKAEVDLYNRRFDEVSALASPVELAEKIRPLKRDRGNQWFTVIRGVVAPTVLVQHHRYEFGQNIAELGKELTRQALDRVAVRGKALIFLAVMRAGECLVEADAVDQADDIFYLEWKELIALLKLPQNRRALIAERRAEAARNAELRVPDHLGPALEPGASRMYLISEVLELLDSQS